ncbi:MAG: hypothetical protein AB1505_13970 [Candidatus Latescibacterota bacterium]
MSPSDPNWNPQEALARYASEMAALRAVYDNDGLFDWGDPRGEGPDLMARIVDAHADTGARGLTWGCGNNLAWSYVPRVQEAWCDHVPQTQAEDYHRLARRQRDWLDLGTSPLDVVAARAQERGLPVLAGFRLNRFMPEYGVESWWTANPDVHLSPASCPQHPAQQSANLALPEVRQHFVESSLDVVARYPVAGLHLEFMRAIPFFERDEPDKAGHLLAFLRELRQGLDRIGQERGRRLELSIWSGTEANYQVIRKGLFPPEFMRLEYHGIDLEGWIREGLVDRLMLSCWSAPRGRRGPPLDPGPWAAMARGTGTQVLGEIDNAADESEPHFLGEALQVIRQTAARCDGVYMFNCPPENLARVLEGGGSRS